MTVTASVAGGGKVSAATPVGVKVGLSDDTATKGTDYATVPNFTITIPVGQSSATGTFTLTPTDDTTIEPTETITLSGVKSQALKYRTGTATVQLLDNDPDAVTITATPSTKAEAAPPGPRDGKSDGSDVLCRWRGTVTVAVGKSGDSATEGTDYATVADFTITIPKNETTAGVDITLAPTNDTLVENNETISVSGSGTNMTVTGASITLTDDDGGIALSASPSSVVEGGGAKTVTVTATGVGTSATARTVTVQVGKSGDSATEGTDYTTVADFTITINANATSGTGTFTLTPTNDTTVEGDEKITVSGTSTGATVTGTSVTLIDDDARIALSANPSSVLELPDVTTVVTVTATLNAAHSSAWTVPVQVGKSGDSATEGTDYTTVSDFNITIPANKTSGTGTFNLQTKSDNVFEGTETISVYGNKDNATVVGTTVSIVDSPEFNPFNLSASPSTVSEGAGATQVTVTVKLGGTATVKNATPVKVQIGQTTDTATEGTDYATVADFTVTIAAGKGSGTGTFTLTPTDDSIAEIDEDIAVAGSVKDHNNVNGTNLTITDNDAEVTLSASPASVSEDAGATTVTVTATLTSLSSTATSVTVSVGKSGDSAVEITDYAEVDDFTISIPSGEKSATGTFTLTPVNDALYEGASESLTIDGSATNATVIDTSVAITDNDGGTKTKVSLSVKPKRVKECSGDTTMTVTAELPDDVYTLSEDRKITLSVGKTDDGATSGTDYTAVDDFDLTIKAGHHTGLATFTLTPTDDADEEGDETLTVHGTATRLEVGNDAEVTIEDDDQPIIVLTMNPAKIPEQEETKSTTVTVTASQWTPGADRCAADTSGSGGAMTMSAPAMSAESMAETAKSMVGASADEIARAVLGPGARQASTNSDQAVTVTVGDTGDTAVSGTDYTAVSSFTITIKSGETSGTATFTTTAGLDSLLEPPESLTVKGAAGTETTVTPAKGQVDDKDQVAPTLTVSPTSVSEGAGDTTVTVTLNTGGVKLSEAVEIPFKVSSGTAASGTDFDAVLDFSEVLKKGETSVSDTFTLTPIDDTLVEDDETIKVSIPGSKPALEATVTLTDNDKPYVIVNNASVKEGDSGTTTLTFTARLTDENGRTKPSTATTTAAYKVFSESDDTATAGTDYTETAGTLTFAPGETSKTVDVSVTGDTVVEGDETLTWKWTQWTNSLLAFYTYTGTIEDDDVAPSAINLSVNPSSVAESAGDTTVTVTATFSNSSTYAADTTVTVSVGETGDSAESGKDYTAVTDFDVTIAAGQTSGSATFTLTPTDDTIIEDDETLTLAGTATGLTVNDTSVTITDDEVDDIDLTVDVEPYLDANPDRVAENAKPTKIKVTAGTKGNATFTMDREVNVTVGDDNDSATEGTDYEDVAGFTVTIKAGQSSGSKEFTLTPTDDTLVEGDETITVSGSASGLKVTATTVTVVDDDTPNMTLAANPSSVSEDAGATTVTVTAATGGVTFKADRTVSVTVGDSTDSATSGTDYAAVTGFDITITKGDTSGTGTFTLTPTDDTLVEDNESISVAGTTPGDLTVAGTSVVITDNDTVPAVNLMASPSSVSEGAGDTTVTVTATFSNTSTYGADTTVTVSVGKSGDNATSGTDYTAVTDFDVTIAAGKRSGTGTFTLTPTDDTLVEGNETLTVGGTATAGDAAGTSLTVNGTSVTLTDNDGAPAINLSVDPSSVSESAGDTTVTVTATFSTASTYEDDTTVTISVGKSADGATSGTDYTAVTDFDVTIKAKASKGSATFTLTPTDDTLMEGNETISVGGSVAAGAEALAASLTVNGTSITLTDDDTPPTIDLSANPATVSEGAGATTVTVTATFSNTSTYAADKTVSVTVGDEHRQRHQGHRLRRGDGLRHRHRGGSEQRQRHLYPDAQAGHDSRGRRRVDHGVGHERGP